MGQSLHSFITILLRATLTGLLLFACDRGHAQQAHLTSFETMPGNEPQLHLGDPDLGPQMDWFRIDDGKWTIRYQDGFVVPLHQTGVESIESRSFIKVAPASGTSEYAIPDPIEDGASIYYRPDPSKAFSAAERVRLMEPDNVMLSANVSITASLAQARDKILGVIPTHIDESGSPEANDYRWAFDADMNMLPVPGTLDRGRAITLQNGVVRLSQSYYGDIETRRTFGGCHLRPVYLRAYLDFKATASQQGDNLLVKPDETHVEVGLLPHSDTGCGFINFDISGIITRVLNTQGVQSGVTSALEKVALTIPLQEVKLRFNKPIQQSVPSIGNVCIYPNPGDIGNAYLNGDFDQATVTFGLSLRPRIIVAAICPTDSPAVWPLTQRDFTEVLPSFIFDLTMTYPQLRHALMQNPSIKNAGITDITFDPMVASATAHLKKSGASDILVNVVPSMAVPERVGEIAIAWHFATSGGLDSGLPDLSGTYVQDITDQARSVMNSLQGQHLHDNVVLSIGMLSVHRDVIVFAPDVIHSYLGLTGFVSAHLTN